MDTYNVIFSGEVAPEHDILQVKQKLAVLYKVPVEKVDAWFSGRPLVIQKNCEYAKAVQIKNGFETTGAICRIESEKKTNDSSASLSSPAIVNPPKPSSPSQMVCPKCGFSQPQRVSCGRCGIIIEKYLEKKKKDELANASQKSSSPQKPETVGLPQPSPEKKPTEKIQNDEKSGKEGKKKKNMVYLVTGIGLFVFVFMTVFVTYQIFEQRAREQAEALRKQQEEFARQQEDLLKKQQEGLKKQQEDLLKKQQEGLKKQDAEKLEQQALEKIYVALKKIEATVSSGVNYQAYSELVSAARVEFELSKKDIFSPKLEQLAEAYDCYQSVKTLWGPGIDGTTKTDTIEAIKQKYPKVYPSPYLDYKNYEKVFQFLWGKTNEILLKYESQS